MRSILIACIAASALVGSARAQNLPAIAPTPTLGFQLPRFGGEWSYALGASQMFITGYNGSGGTVASTNVSGDFAYDSATPTHPFGLVYSGGYLGSESSQLPSSTFQNLAISQAIKREHWSIVANDTVSYLPESPVGGLSGVPGVGDLGTLPIDIGVVSGPGILTNYDTRVSNIAGVSGQRDLTGSTYLQGSGNYAIQRFLDNQGIQYSAYDSNEAAGGGGIMHRINARNTIGANYLYSKFTYVSEPFSFTSNGVNLEYIYHWTRKLTLDAAAGPQLSDSSTFSSTAASVAASIALTYTGERGSASLSYIRGTNAGAGVVEGALTDSVGFNAGRRLNRLWSAAAAASYTHSQSLPSIVFQPFSIQSEVASGQLSRALSPSLSAYFSYTLEHQTSTGSSLSSLTFNGLQQVFGFGITYSPAIHHMGRP